MEAVKTLTLKSGTSIPSILLPTFQIFTPGHTANKSSILATPRVTHTYGPHPRQTLDLYLPPSSPSPNSTLHSSDPSPILIFLHGGGLTHGSKLSPEHPLVYHSTGSFFAQRGVTTIIPDYRRVGVEGEDAAYPSGGEDVSLTLKWVVANLCQEGEREVVVMGNSAGGVHASTWAFDSLFLEERKGMSGGNLRVKGVVELAVPFDFAEGVEGAAVKYFGGKEGEKCAVGIVEALGREGVSREEVAVPKVLVLLGEYEPEIIEGPTGRFVEAWKRVWGEGLEFKVLKGHNHISPPWALMAGEAEGEKWAEDLVEWIKN
ncbi:alpha/beta-Hydrolase [Glarea lozoyensis ATCC 20868]|uniref:Alpha/beta-Hydrolase n=1 Tax=Glarea lozoyensis (strain ATCC 20868 / MF5171) TaxID=1116229 RepID=S3D5L4_GLAL2|nr:alpha/beta-Hydrolase [Glarea lozoyensis ATCC 20868]EPE33055.1 alpha/beta-Hydrolase [Glarea lozoyensis ATCC 20868]